MSNSATDEAKAGALAVWASQLARHGIELTPELDAAFRNALSVVVIECQILENETKALAQSLDRERFPLLTEKGYIA